MRKRFFFVIITALFAVSVVMGQSGNSNKSNSEMSIEESYLQEAIELMIIRETTKSGSREQKFIALEHIGNALERGSTNDELRTALEYLCLEGTQNKATMGGRQISYPDVRRQAARYLSGIVTKESKDSLIRVCISENEPMVLQEAIRSLGIVGLNDNDDAINAIVRVTEHNLMSTAPDNLVALAALDALDKICTKYKTATPTALMLIINISTGPYNRPVQDLARQVLVNIRKIASKQ
ncbi:MAG: HEAT repeat domain-containing protein [Treponema sp.]|jgi:hypothetical protein|nr:HEAT repeat domain-containing protein [Treponema sp.]